MHLFKKQRKEKVFGLKGIDEGHRKITYRGIPCIKCPFDYVLYQMIITTLKPNLIIEIGTNFGGSALYMADLLNVIGKGEIHSIDITNKAPNLVKQHERIHLFHEGWERYDRQLAKEFSTVLVIEDASHKYANTLAAINVFAPLVTKNSYLIVEDGIIEELGLSKQYDGGPVRAIEEFLQKNQDFEIDYQMVNFFGGSATFNTKGYLKKIN